MASFDVHDKALQTHQHPRGAKYYSPGAGQWYLWNVYPDKLNRWVGVAPPGSVLSRLLLLPTITQNPNKEHEDAMSLADGMAWEQENTPLPPQVKVPENSGGSCSYYEKEVYSVALNKVQLVECKDVMTALGLNHDEMNIFKEVWRSAAARQGKKKEGHTALRGANKIFFFADENLKRLTQQA